MDAYIVIVILQPTAKARHDEGAVPQIVVPLTTVIAKDEAQASMKAMRLVPEEHAEKIDRLDVKVLSFRSALARV
jgi:hypothetical protein